jgi:glutathione S-transferase
VRLRQVRLALKIGGVEFDDDRIDFKDWPTIKPTTPFGQLPVMSVEGAPEPIAQSGAM